jgi:hypothetical protein
MKSYLSGNPEIRLALNEDLGIGRSGSSTHGTSLTPLAFPPLSPNLGKCCSTIFTNLCMSGHHMEFVFLLDHVHLMLKPVAYTRML